MNSASRSLVIAITTGEPAGVGPELTVAALADASQRWPSVRFCVLGDRTLLAERSGSSTWPLAGAPVEIEHHALGVPSTAGTLDAANGLYVLALLDTAIDGAVSSRSTLSSPRRCKRAPQRRRCALHRPHRIPRRPHPAPHVVMMLAGTGERPLRVALTTTHLPLKDVSAALTIEWNRRDAAHYRPRPAPHFGLPAPRILVTGLNPHAGENGYLGREEIDVIAPALNWRGRWESTHPALYPADTLFHSRCSTERRRLRTRDVPRPGFAGPQIRDLRRRHQCHARAADHPDLSRSRHGARPRRHRPRGRGVV